ncbi:pore-forming protein, partial [Lactobacillus salivarius]|nr:pore-forming protein [Ligilactobacillus salivarius]
DIKKIEIRKYGLFIKTKYRDYRLIVSKRFAESAYNNMTK